MNFDGQLCRVYQSAELFTLRGTYVSAIGAVEVTYPQLTALTDINSFWDFPSGYEIVGWQMSTSFIGSNTTDPMGVALVVGRKEPKLAVSVTLPALGMQVAISAGSGPVHDTASLGEGFCKKAPPGTRIALYFFGPILGTVNRIDTIANVYAVPVA